MNADTVKILEQEIAWFSRVLDYQFKTYFGQEVSENEFELMAPPDVSRDTSPYGTLVNTHSLEYSDRLALMLALMPHVRPQLLDIFFTKNAHFDRAFTEFGGVVNKRHTGFLPTGETLQFLLHKTSLTGRIAVEEMLSESGKLAQCDLLHIESTERGEPFLSGLLVITEECKSLLFTGKAHMPETSERFPARKIQTNLDWEDLVINSDILEEIDQIKTWVQQEHSLMRCTTFRKHVKPGYRALFFGPPGTGKTLTACLLGRATGLEVYRVDLSLTVSKYIGETEKNLARLFESAQRRRWILFFDEADALFGKRTQTNSSNDRYANQEVSYLLQRIEDFPGMIILASNLKSNMDEAFSRRFQSMIYFPMPTKEQRLALWKQFSSGAITFEQAIDLHAIAEKFELSGGSAINVFRFGALRAASRRSNVVREEDLLLGIRREFQKYGKTL